MRRDVLLKITGKQKYDQHSDKIELTTNGTLEETEDAYIIRYIEENEQPIGEAKVKVTVKKDASEVMNERIQPSGNSCLVIKENVRSICAYSTPYGMMSMGIFGKKIEYFIDDSYGEFKLKYTIDFDGHTGSYNDLIITFKEKD